MSDASASPRRNRRGRGHGPALVAWSAAALFLALLALLATRVAAGEDPALRARAAATPLPARRVLIRRVYERRVVIHLPATAPPQAPQASQQVSSGGSYSSGMPATRTS
jgi:hypothetical protein